MSEFDFFRKKRMNNLDGQSYVYKYFRLGYLLPMLKNKKLRVDKITTWEDPYENFFLKEEFYTYSPFCKEEMSVETGEVSERIYGQSWTLKEESDAMWRIYSNTSGEIDDIAVKLKIQVDDLFDLVYTKNECMATTSIGRVEYKSISEFDTIRSDFANRASVADLTELIQKCLYCKRDSFAHEEEVRIIVLNSTNEEKRKFLEYEIPSLDVFVEFVLDPRVTEVQEEDILRKLEDVGVPKDIIRKSDLYAFMPISIKI